MLYPGFPCIGGRKTTGNLTGTVLVHVYVHVYIHQAPQNWLSLSGAEIERHVKGFSYPGAVLEELDAAGSAGTDIQNNSSVPFNFFSMDTTRIAYISMSFFSLGR